MPTLSSISLQTSKLFVAIQLHTEIGSDSGSNSWKPRKRLSFCDAIRRNRNTTYALGCGFLGKYSTVKLFVSDERNRGSIACLAPLALGLQEEAIDGEVIMDPLNPLDELPQRDEEGLNGVHSSVVYTKGEENEERESGDELREKKDQMIDTRALARSMRFAKTAEDIEKCLKDKGELPPQVFTAVIRGLGKDKNVDSAIALVEWLKEKKKENNVMVGPNLFIYNSLLGAMKQAQVYQHMEKIINDMVREGIHPNIVTYNTLMGAYTEQGRELEALKLFEEIQNKGLSPSYSSYSTALLAYRRLEDGFGALKLYLDFKEKYRNGEIVYTDDDWENEAAKLDDFTLRICYQVMRRWLVKRENLSINVLKFLAEMDKAGLKIGRSEEERLVWACTREEHFIVAKELYNRIREKDSEISTSVCNHVIWVLGKARKWWAALEVYEDMLDRGPQPNNMSYELIISHFNILLSAARKRGIWRWGVRLLNKMEEKGLKPGSKEWNSVLIACSKASETAAAVQIFKRMVENGETPTVISYGALLSALEKGKLYDEAIQVWKHMVKIGVEPNLYAYTIMASIQAGQRKYEEVELIIQEMRSHNIEPSVVTFNAIISACARDNMGARAYVWFQRMKVENVEANEISYEMVIEALANDGKPRLAYELYLSAKKEGMDLSRKAYDVVIRSSQEYGASIDESLLGPQPPEKKKKVVIRKNLSKFCDLADVPRRSKPFERQELYTSRGETS